MEVPQMLHKQLCEPINVQELQARVQETTTHNDDDNEHKGEVEMSTMFSA